jgi:serine/threonine-protein kinase
MSLHSSISSWIGRSIGDRDRYQIKQLLGQGGMGAVFLAMDIRLHCHVAIKILKSDWVTTQELHQRFENEMRISAALRNTNIIAVQDYGISPEGCPFYVMEYLEGQSLAQLMDQGAWIPMDRTVQIVSQVCAGLQHAHQGVRLADGQQIHIVHRDLKPENIFLVADTTLGELVKILDFGIAKIRSDRQENHGLTMEGAFLGTPAYASPEQCFGKRQLDARSDIYSLGIILYELLSGQNPFGLDRQAHLGDWCEAHCTQPIQSLRQYPRCERISPDLEATIVKCLAKSPDDRFNSVTELREALQNAVLQMSLPPTSRIGHSQPASYTKTSGHAKTSGYFRTSSPSQAVNPSSPAPSSQALQPPPSIPAAKINDFSQETCQGANHLPARELKQSTPPRSTFLYPIQTLNSQFVRGWRNLWRWVMNLLTLPRPTFASIADKVPTQGWQQQKSLTGVGAINAIALSPDLRILAGLSYQVTGQNKSSAIVRTWDLHTKRVLRADSITHKCISIFFDLNGELWANNIGRKGEILVKNLYSNQQSYRLFNPKGNVSHLVPVPDGQSLVSLSTDGFIRFWDFQKQKVLGTIVSYSKTIRNFTIDANCQIMASITGRDRIDILNLRSYQRAASRQKESIFSLRGNNGWNSCINAVSLSAEGQTLVGGNKNGTIKIWDLQARKITHHLKAGRNAITAVSLSLDAKTLVTGDQKGKITIWQCSD